MFAARIARSTPRVLGGTRTYAAAATQSVKPPVQLFGVDGTYASALYTASAKSSSIDATDKALQTLKALITKDTRLSQILASPTLNPHEKSVIVTEVQKATGNDKNVTGLLQVLAENNRLGLIEAIIDQYATLIKAHKGEIEAIITSAQPLDAKTVSRLEAAITKSQYVGQGQKLKISNKINPEILGGLVVEIGDRTIDLSISSKMTKLNKLLTDAL
ncbi:OSCP/delta subunit of ATPase [Peziza echinospora]|nr:OSCP/delta subunit of ATPase [Peziza echinospora]